MADDRFNVVVVGSCFVDMISYVPRLPQSGETVKGTKFQLDFGGKAANQCVMAQKLGANTIMVAKIGNDQFGKDTIQNFKRFGVNTDFISATDKADTGVTNIGKGSNQPLSTLYKMTILCSMFYYQPPSRPSLREQTPSRPR